MANPKGTVAMCSFPKTATCIDISKDKFGTSLAREVVVDFSPDAKWEVSLAGSLGPGHLCEVNAIYTVQMK